jgi:hypothetical protein
MPLTDVQVRNAKADSKPRKLADGRGLYLYVSVAGGKSWRLDYNFFGKRKTLTLGGYPALSLASARVERDEAKRKLVEVSIHRWQKSGSSLRQRQQPGTPSV